MQPVYFDFEKFLRPHFLLLLFRAPEPAIECAKYLIFLETVESRMRKSEEPQISNDELTTQWQ